SHDLRTPLTMIIGYGEAIRDLPEEDTHENIQVVIEEAKRLTRLVDDVLDLSKLRAGTQSVDYQTVDLCEIVGRMVTRCHRLVEPNGFSVRFETDEKLVVQADELRLSQAVYNLIGNALAHVGDDQTVVVRAERCETFARVSVIDHGDGISAEDREAIWERYYSRGHAKSNSGVDNTGLGLSIVRAVVDLHGGECGVEDAPQGGSAFWFTIPLSETKG
ncbi:MAG: HAMP domain-containing histidine kinase, partial [Clostridia bacterium]|nr:HAMP domain-containing histidine kinase [Clostridia bacterium]